MEKYIVCFIVYAILGWAFGKIIERYMHELEFKLNEMFIRGDKIYISLGKINTFNSAVLIIGGIFWPISDIVILLNAEWKFSKLTQN